MKSPVRSACGRELPPLGVRQSPMFLVAGADLWLAYVRAEDDGIAIVRFVSMKEHRIFMGNAVRHADGLVYPMGFGFHEVPHRVEALRTPPLSVRRWVVNFLEGSLDIVALSPQLVVASASSLSMLDALNASVAAALAARVRITDETGLYRPR